MRAATRMAILSKFQDDEALVIDDFSCAEVKTKPVAAVLKALKLDKTSCLISTAESDANLYKSARNIARVEILPAMQLNAYTVLKQKRLLLTKAALEKLREKKA
jgi:large subunit ribosomal protein L4